LQADPDAFNALAMGGRPAFCRTGAILLFSVTDGLSEGCGDAGRIVKRVARALLIAAAMFGVYFLVNIPSLYARVKLDRSFPALSRYEFERTPDIVLVGSSMTYRLYEGYFRTPLRNIAIGGGSPITGLAIVASYQSLPRLIVVETNIMSRSLDRALVEQFGADPVEPYKWFRPARALISRIYTWAKYRSEAENVERLPKQEPAEYDISGSVADAFEEYHRPDWQYAMRPNVDELKRLVAMLERRGCRLLMVEMPAPPEIENTPYAAAARALTHEAFPDESKWLTISDERRQLRWLDASHLDERSAIIVADQIDNAIAARRWASSSTVGYLPASASRQ
jgi:hypothetical protein